MPAYDYRCTLCDTVFEVTRKAGESVPEPCPECGGATKRVFTPVGVHFKGSGFHNTDYKKQPADTSSEKPKADAAPAPCGADKSSGSACASCPAASGE